MRRGVSVFAAHWQNPAMTNSTALNKLGPVNRSDGAFFRRMSWALALLVLAGFAPSYYLRTLATAPPMLTTLMHAHGAVFSLWMVLLVMQTTLIGAGYVEWHRRLGWASVAVASAMLLLAGSLAYERTLTWLEDPSFDSYEVLAFLAVPSTTIVFFSVMYVMAIALRRHSAVHKRLLLIASMDICTPAISRLPLIGALSAGWHYAAMDLLLLVLAWHDWRTLRRLHPATLLGAAALIASQAGREWLGWTDRWLDFAIWLTS
jgi:hypothetical protein